MSTLSDRLFEEILQARRRVYAVGEPTPLQKLNLPSIQAPVYASGTWPPSAPTNGVGSGAWRP
ncbi:MAG: hypothetical protein ACLSUW_00780 [Akkermansia sp.]